MVLEAGDSPATVDYIVAIRADTASPYEGGCLRLIVEVVHLVRLVQVFLTTLSTTLHAAYLTDVLMLGIDLLAILAPLILPHNGTRCQAM